MGRVQGSFDFVRLRLSSLRMTIWRQDDSLENQAHGILPMKQMRKLRLPALICRLRAAWASLRAAISRAHIGALLLSARDTEAKKPKMINQAHLSLMCE